MSLGSYSHYKESETEWLGKVPEHWVLTPIKQIGRLKSGTSFPQEEQGQKGGKLPFFKVSALGQAKADGILLPSESTVSYETAARLGAFIFPSSSIVFAKVGAALFLNRIRSIDKPACIDNNMMGLIVQPKHHIPFVLYAMNLVKFDFIANPGAIPSLNETQVGNYCLAIPPLQEQQLITSFLDQETAKIAALIDEQQKLIALLKEKRQAIISHAVTKGLNPKAQVKETGIKWLDKVPKHWKIVPFKRIVSSPITDGPHETPQFYDEGIPFVSAEAVSTGRIDFLKIRGCISEEDHLKYSLKYSPRMHDIYLIKSGATTGMTAIVEERIDFNIWSALAAIRCGKEANPYFVLHFMRSKNFQDAISLNWSFGTQPNIGLGVIENLPCTIPPMHEQMTIVDYLKCETDKLDALTAEAVQVINLLQERCKALIYEAVTGKIDVRGQTDKAVG